MLSRRLAAGKQCSVDRCQKMFVRNEENGTPVDTDMSCITAPVLLDRSICSHRQNGTDFLRERRLALNLGSAQLLLPVLW